VETIHSGSEAGVIRVTWGYLVPAENKQYIGALNPKPPNKPFNVKNPHPYNNNKNI
jgi:hypothetical protein